MSRQAKDKRGRKNRSRRRTRLAPPVRRKIAAARKKVKRPSSDPRLEAAVLEMNRGRSLTATARSLRLSPQILQRFLRQQRLSRRKGKRWVTEDTRLRRVPVMTKGRFQIITVRGYEEARLVGEHHYSAGEFVRTNDAKFIKPFQGRSVKASNGRKYLLETDPNALHRIAAMDSLPFHEIYEITSNT